MPTCEGQFCLYQKTGVCNPANNLLFQYKYNSQQPLPPGVPRRMTQEEFNDLRKKAEAFKTICQDTQQIDDALAATATPLPTGP